jgi:RimJ/RimL family protein N-acetyltransferase
VVVTPRLRLRRFTAADLDDLVALDADPEVMRYLTGGRPTPRASVAAEVLPKIMRGYARGGGRFAAIARARGEFLGWVALDQSDGAPDEPELGYRLRRSAWGHGYATEGARALVDLAFTELGAVRVWAQTMAVNTRSRRVMEAVGLHHVGTQHLHFDDPIPGTEHGEVYYELRRAEWSARRNGA